MPNRNVTLPPIRKHEDALYTVTKETDDAFLVTIWAADGNYIRLATGAMSTYMDLIAPGQTAVLANDGKQTWYLVAASGLADAIDDYATITVELAATTNDNVKTPVDFACEIVQVTLTADTSGSATVDVLKATYSGYPTFSSIAASAKPALSSAQKYQDSTLTGWTRTIAAGDILKFNVDSVSGTGDLTVSLKVRAL